MCLEDLRLARGREVGKIVPVANNVSGVQVLDSNPNRVAITLAAAVTGGGGTMVLSHDSQNQQPFAGSIDLTPIPVVLRIEDLGQLITSPIFATGNSAGGAWAITEIISYVSVTPFARIEDRNKV